MELNGLAYRLSTRPITEARQHVHLAEDCWGKPEREAGILVHVSDKIMDHAGAAVAQLFQIVRKNDGTNALYII